MIYVQPRYHFSRVKEKYYRTYIIFILLFFSYKYYFLLCTIAGLVYNQ